MKDFNGTTDLINLGSPAALNNIGGSDGPRSIAAWIYPQGWGEGGFGRIWDKGTFQSTGWFFYLTNDVVAAFKIAIGSSGTGPSANAAASTLALNAHRFIAGTWLGVVGTNAPRLWVGSASSAVAEVSYNSTSVGSGVYGSDASDTAYVGNRAAADRTFDGLIGHLSVWDNELTAAQLDMLRLFPYAPMHRFSTAGGTVINLKGYYPMWESAAATCLDHSGNRSHGTVTGTSVGAEPPFTFTRRGARATIWTPAAVGGAAEGAHGAMYPRMQRHIHQSWTMPRIG